MKFGVVFGLVFGPVFGLEFGPGQRPSVWPGVWPGIRLGVWPGIWRSVCPGPKARLLAWNLARAKGPVFGLELRRSLQQREIPYAIRIIAEKRLEELKTNMKHGSIDIYITFIQDFEQLKHKHHAKAAYYNEEIEVFSREMANIKLARRVLKGEER